jgi:hypothetical protein
VQHRSQLLVCLALLSRRRACPGGMGCADRQAAHRLWTRHLMGLLPHWLSSAVVHGEHAFSARELCHTVTCFRLLSYMWT